MAKSETLASPVQPEVSVEPAHDTGAAVAKEKLDVIRRQANAKTVKSYVFTQDVWNLLVKHGGKEVVNSDTKSVCGLPCKVMATRADAIREVNRSEQPVGCMFV